MTVPVATYRLQFRQDMDFDRAVEIVPYLARLGVSHLYASPLFQAVPGSTHGYDVTDHGRFDDSLGGMAGFLRLSDALQAAGLGLLLDIVPNHMAASSHNPWWRDVLFLGKDSRYAGHFDIDWSAPKILLPILGGAYGDLLETEAFAIGCDADGLTWRYDETELPLAPGSWRSVLEPAGIALPADVQADPRGWFAAWRADPANAQLLDEALQRLRARPDILHRVHEDQHWRLCYWRAARESLTYRRFFEITDLVGVRVEDPDVFGDVHRLVFELLEAGHVHGLRIDHVDGLADPSGYLRRLKDTAPGSPPIWVEKILAGDEEVPSTWPVAGTTGYEVAGAISGLLTDRAGVAKLSTLYGAFIGVRPKPERMLASAKQSLLTYNFAAELAHLTRLADEVATLDLAARDWGTDSLRRAAIAVATVMPVYRTYLTAGEAAPGDAALLDQVESAARAVVDHEDPDVVSIFLRLIRIAAGPSADRLRARFQQLTGALMAKAMEDTLFYRYTRLLSANEVGNEPEQAALSLAEFDRFVIRRCAAQPDGLVATATHDTKRGEDARMRIAAIADSPDAWADAVGRWDRLLTGAIADPPDADARWLFYQALLGAWDTEDPADLAARMEAFMIKAAREAKRATTWTRPDEAYEQRLIDFVRLAFAPESGFLQHFATNVAPIIAAGFRKSLIQLALKLTLPGIPDLYQGSELPDLSLVDPDNRRPVNFSELSALLDAAVSTQSPSELKIVLLRELLAVRNTHRSLFQHGSYRRLACNTPAAGRYFGFYREYGAQVLVVLSDLANAAVGGDVPGFDFPFSQHEVSLRPVPPSSALNCVQGILRPGEDFRRMPLCIAIGHRAN